MAKPIDNYIIYVICIILYMLIFVHGFSFDILPLQCMIAISFYLFWCKSANNCMFMHLLSKNAGRMRDVVRAFCSQECVFHHRNRRKRQRSSILSEGTSLKFIALKKKRSPEPKCNFVMRIWAWTRQQKRSQMLFCLCCIACPPKCYQLAQSIFCKSLHQEDLQQHCFATSSVSFWPRFFTCFFLQDSQYVSMLNDGAMDSSFFDPMPYFYNIDSIPPYMTSQITFICWNITQHMYIYYIKYIYIYLRFSFFAFKKISWMQSSCQSNFV